MARGPQGLSNLYRLILKEGYKVTGCKQIGPTTYRVRLDDTASQTWRVTIILRPEETTSSVRLINGRV